MDDSYSGGIFTYGGDGVTKNVLYDYLEITTFAVINIVFIYLLINDKTNIYLNVLIIPIFIFIFDTIYLIPLLIALLMHSYYNEEQK